MTVQPRVTTEPAPDSLTFSGAVHLAFKVWRDGPQSKAALVPDRAPATVIDSPLALAVQRGWLRVEGDAVMRGTTNPIPLEEIGDVDLPRWGPGVLRKLFRW